MLSLFMGLIRVDADADGCLSVRHPGETSRFAEVEPGLCGCVGSGRIQDFGGNFRTTAFATDPQERQC